MEKATKLAKTKSHDIDLVIDQVVIKESLKHRLSESVNTALAMAEGKVVVETFQGKRQLFSMKSACPECGYSFSDLEPRLFSFNNPRGYCPTCHGLGTLDYIEEEVFSEGEVGNKKLSQVKYTLKNQKENEDDEDSTFEPDLSICPDCLGDRLKPEALSVKINGKSIAELSQFSCGELKFFLADLLATTKKKTVSSFKEKDKFIAEKIIQQISSRLDYLIRVGAGYLSMSRSSRTLSGGEAQRIRLATQVGSSLIGVLYVMDEPSIGLHPRDHHRLLNIIAELRDRGNTIILVEHDEDTILFADYVVDLGPRAGKLGGEILAEGTPKEISQNSNSLTGKYLKRELRVPVPKHRRQGNGTYIELKGAKGNNLKNVNLRLPLGVFNCITGVSGSGKSTLIIDTLYKILAREFYNSSVISSPYDKITGLENIDKVIEIDQKPIGRTPRSTPATYVG